MINPAKMDQRLTIQSGTVTRGNAGGVTMTWADVARVWAEKIETTGSEARRAGALRAETTIIFRIRFRADLTTRHRLIHRGDTYDVLQITEGDRGEEQFVQARTTEGVED